MRVGLACANGDVCFHGKSRIEGNSFYHIAVTFDGSSGMACLYVDGVCETSINCDSQQISYRKTDLWLGGEALGLGRKNHGMQPRHKMKGTIENMEILGRVKSEEEIETEYDAGAPSPD